MIPRFYLRLFHVTIWISHWRMNTLVTSQYQSRLSSITKIFSRRISQSDCSIQIKLNYSCIALGLKITQIKIPRNIVERLWHINNVTSYEDFQFKILAYKQCDVIWRHSSLKCKDQTLFGFVYASILIEFN